MKLCEFRLAALLFLNIGSLLLCSGATAEPFADTPPGVDRCHNETRVHYHQGYPATSPPNCHRHNPGSCSISSATPWNCPKDTIDDTQSVSRDVDTREVFDERFADTPPGVDRCHTETRIHFHQGYPKTSPPNGHRHNPGSCSISSSTPWNNPPGTIDDTQMGSSRAGGICDDPRTIGFMDEWLSRAVPTRDGSYRFDPWARLVGSSTTTRVGPHSMPPTGYNWSTRCIWLKNEAWISRSRNLGTLGDYVTKRLAE